MSIRPSSLRAFLSTSRQALHNAIRSKTQVTLVVGNESADLDSIVSSILYAYLQTAASQQESTPAGRPGDLTPAKIPYVPICNIPQQDIHIRPELLALLPHAHLESSYLLTVSDLPTEQAAAQNLVHSLVLVDHNNPAGPLTALLSRAFASSKIAGCIDHHVDERVVPPRVYPRRIVTPCGSCTSLVMLQMASSWEALTAAASESRIAGGQDDAYTGVDDGAARKAWDVDIAKLAMGPVLVDTHNLEDPDKVTDLDKQAATMLEGRIASKEPHWHRKRFWKELRAAKNDLSGLTVDEILRKDYKEYESKDGTKRLGIASVVKQMGWLNTVEKEPLLEELLRFRRDHSLDTLAIGTHFRDAHDKSRRELALLGPLVRRVDATTKEDLGLEQAVLDMGGPDFQAVNFELWEQKRTDKSRKQVAPILRALLE